MKTPVLELNLFGKSLILVGVPVLFELIVCLILAALLAQAESEAFRERHARAIVAESNALLNDFIQAAVYLRLYKTVKSEAFLAKHNEIIDEIPRRFRSLQIMAADSPREKQMIERLESASRNSMQMISDARQMSLQESDFIHWTGSGDEPSLLAAEVISGLRRFVKEQEEAETADTYAEGRTRLLVRNMLVLALLGNVGIAVVLALYFNKGTVNRLKVLVENTHRLARGQSLAPQIKGADEIAHLDGVFHEMADELEATAMRKRELVNMVTHDLRTPLTSIQSTLTLLADGVLGELPERAGRKVTIATASAGRLIGLINDLLDIEKLEAGKMKITPKPQALNPIVEAALSSVLAFAESSGVELVYEAQDLQVEADADRIVQVLINLLSNAVKFSPQGSDVTVEAEQIDNEVELRVIDKGRGIPPESIKGVFERFVQVDPANPVEKKGSGLGLPICKAIIEEHGGKIGVESKPGEGSKFWIRLKNANG